MKTESESSKTSAELKHSIESRIGTPPLLKTGIEAIDKFTWGLSEGQLFFVAARPCHGKTSFINTLEAAMQAAGVKHVGYNESWLTDKGIYSAMELVDVGVKHTSAKVVLLDYLQLLRGENCFNFDMVVELKELARRLNVLVVVTSQLPRKIERRQDKRPLIYDVDPIVDSIANTVAFLYNDCFYPEQGGEPNTVEFIVVKNNSGITGSSVLAINKQKQIFQQKTLHN